MVKTAEISSIKIALLCDTINQINNGENTQAVRKRFVTTINATIWAGRIQWRQILSGEMNQ